MAVQVGDTAVVRELASEDRLSDNPVRQLRRPAATARVTEVTADHVSLNDGTDAPFAAFLDAKIGHGGPYLAAPIGSKSMAGVSLENCTWLGQPAPDHPDAVRDALEDRFQMVEAKGDGQSGFRLPQVGAIHSVLGFWTTDPKREATVVMPTGTGKTDTMVALFAAARPERLLVLVPSDALRTQIAAKFETLGILPAIGALGPGSVPYPVVGRLEKGIDKSSEARSFARRCNIVVATPNALNACSDRARIALTSEFSHLFIDEAHHVRAVTWEAIRSRFAGKKVLQFTATPYREDGQDLGGRMIYTFPLRRAQELNYFSHINYRGVRSLADQDQIIAATALDQLRSDRASGLDHVVMARVKHRPRADDIVKIYQALGPEFGPRVLYSGMTSASAKRDALAALEDRSCRVIVCVDMLGEGFDLPALKIAAIHDPHKSLGVTLQFVGRFARVAPNVGDATAVVGRPDSIGDETLRSLYAEDPDWNLIIRDLSEAATEAEEQASEFDDGFVNVPIGLATHQIQPKMSTVVYRTRCEDWEPDSIVAYVGQGRLETDPVPINRRTHTAWFIVRDESRASWGPNPGFVNVAHDLYVLFWDRSSGLLYINSSNNDSADKHHEKLAEAICGADVERIRGDAVFRIFGGVERLIPTNVGLLDIRNRARKHAQYAGANVNEGFPEAERGTKTQTNIFAHGHDDGDRVQLGASLAGRVWSRSTAQSILHWMRWCEVTGAKLTDSSLDIDEILASFIRPQLLDGRPELTVLAVEWPAAAYGSLTGKLRARTAGGETPLIDTEIQVTAFDPTGPIPVSIVGDGWSVPYLVDIDDKGITAEPAGAATIQIVTSSRSMTLSEYVRQDGLTLFCEHDAVIEFPGVLYVPNRDLAAFPTNQLRTHVDWTDIDLTVESQGPHRKVNSIQRRVIETMSRDGVQWSRPDPGSDNESWDLIIDDDGSNELADVVAMRVSQGVLRVQLVHCKYSSESTPGARIVDLYEVCGQAQKSVARRRDLTQLVPHLLRREKNRHDRGHSGFEVGNEETLYEIEASLHTLQLELSIVVVQPGVSTAKISNAQLDLLAATEMFVLEVGGATFEVIVSS